MWIQTYTGKKFYPLDASPKDIDILDIAHALSLVCRYNGHCKQFYSVAQHSVIMVKETSNLPGTPQWKLLHDSAEAYISDICRPIKPYIINYDTIENRILECVAIKFNLNIDEYKDVKKADDTLLVTEQRDIMGPYPDRWNVDAEPLDYIIPSMTWKRAKKQFLFCAKELGLM